MMKNEGHGFLTASDVLFNPTNSPKKFEILNLCTCK